MCQVHLDQEKFVSGSLKHWCFLLAGALIFFEIAAKIVGFDFITVSAF